MKRIIAITPARDEERLLPGLLASMTAQRCRPVRWIIIDDGSDDDTASILRSAAGTYPWLQVHHLPRQPERAAGGESVIMRFLPRDVSNVCDFVLRLDADITFDPHLTERLLEKFKDDPKLGIAGAVLHEPSRSGWREVVEPNFHTRGAVKMYSSACFEAIGGLQAGIGWDTIDEAHAMMLGFRTRSFRDIIAYHHRPQGAAGGLWRSRIGTGRTAYVIGYSPVFMLARALRRVTMSPPLLGSLLLLAGYLDGHLRQMPRTASPELVKFIRREQRRRLLMMPSQWR